MRIAICDDHQPDIDALAGMVRQLHGDWSITTYDNGKALLDDFEQGIRFDLIFLDIYMGQLSGMDVAVQLRQQDCHSALIFLTSSRDFAVESYEVRALTYLLKPIQQEKIAESLDLFLTQFRPKQVRLGNHFFVAQDILYLESHAKKVIVHCRDGNDVGWTARLEDVATDLIGGNFLRCHRSYVVNMDEVRRVDGYVFVLSSGTRVPIRRQDKGDMVQHYFQYLVE